MTEQQDEAPLEAADLSTGAIWSRKRYKHAYAVDEEWQRYRVWLLFGQGLGQRHESALNVNETPIELGMLFGVRIWVRLERVTPDSGR